MATEVLLPKQGNTVESCIILEWKKAVGDSVSTGEPIAEVETDKATFDVEAIADGVILALLANEGDDVPVLTPIAAIGEAGERYEATGGDADRRTAKTETPAAGGTAPAAAAPAGEPATAAKPDGERPAVSPRARALAAKRGIDPATLSGSGPGGRVIERDVVAAAGEPMTPAAAAQATANGSSPPSLGTGIGGRVRTDNLQPAGAPAADAFPDLQGEFPGPVEEIPVRSVRKRIAERMHESLATTAQLTLNGFADARGLLTYRKKLKAADEALGLARITVNDLLLFAASRVVPRFPEVNAHFTGEAIRRFQAVHLGFAVDTPKGLMVPVIRHASLRSLADLAAESKRLATACIEGTVAPDEFEGGTFTITNLGALGIETFTPVLNTPQVAILGVGSVAPKPVMQGDEVEFVPSIGLSLTIDHQAVDGAPGARFLKALIDNLAQFELLLAR